MASFVSWLLQRIASLLGKQPVGSQEKTPSSSPENQLVALSRALLSDAQELKGDDKAGKAKMAMKAKRILQAVSGPEEMIGGYAVAMGEIGALYQWMAWKLFDKIPMEGSISYKELAASINGEEALVSRLGGMLVSTGKLVQTSSGHVSHSKLSPIFKSKSPPGNLFRVMYEHGLRGYTHWQEYFEKYGNKEPTGVSHNPFTFGWGHSALTVWEVVDLDQERAEVFASAMKSMGSIAGRYGGPASIYDFGWIGKEAVSGSSFKRPLIVDVGGSHGETLKHILDAVPSIPQDRCVLQDRPEVIEEVVRAGNPALASIKKMGHDFLQENPVEGAMIYLLRRVLHDWSDETSIKILSKLAAALPTNEPRARVLIMDQVVSDPPSVRSAAADMIMLNIGGKERNELMFTRIVEAAGMKIIKFHRKEGTEVGVVECAKA